MYYERLRKIKREPMAPLLKSSNHPQGKGGAGKGT